MWGGRFARGVSIATKFLLQLFFPKEKLKNTHKRLSILNWSQYPQIIKTQIPPPTQLSEIAQTSSNKTVKVNGELVIGELVIGSSLQMLDCFKPNSFQIVECGIVVFGLPSWVF